MSECKIEREKSAVSGDVQYKKDLMRRDKNDGALLSLSHNWR